LILENDLWHAFVKKTPTKYVLCRLLCKNENKKFPTKIIQYNLFSCTDFLFLKLRIDAKENKPIKLSCQDAASG
jgi:hypothetical protein